MTKHSENHLHAAANSIADKEIQESETEKSMLLNISSDMSAIRDKTDMLYILHERLKRFFYFSHALTLKTNVSRKTYTGYIVDPDSVCKNYPDYNNIVVFNYSLESSVMKEAFASKETTAFDLDEIIDRIDLPNWIKMNYDCGIREMVITPLHAWNRHIGFFVILSDRKGLLQSKQIKLIQGISFQLSNTIASLLSNEDTVKRDFEKSTLLELSNELAAVRNKTDLHRIINEKLKKLITISHIVTCIISDDQKSYQVFLIDPESRIKNHKDFPALAGRKYLIEDGITDVVLAAGYPVVFDLDELTGRSEIPDYLIMNHESGIKEVVYSALNNKEKQIGILIIFLTIKDQLDESYLNLIQGISSQLSTAIANIVANEKIEKQFEEITRYKKQLEEENLYLQEEIQTTHNYSEIIGTSDAMKKVFHLVSKVSDSQSSVLILGETGTGKELIARALHNTSLRKDKLMIKVNCATLPANLIESELFGHERGSFTGATDRRIGKFELANNSTLFLDEVGELPLDLQVKLLRALQEKEIERVGGKSVIKTDVRIIAATNRNLLKEVQAGNFRSDLYFRLNVFPITIPPLRERKEDIPRLAHHFLMKHAKKGKTDINFSARVVKELIAYDWPGNVRELEHLIERSILLANGTTITQVFLPVLENVDERISTSGTFTKTIDEIEREYIISVLKRCNGKVAGIGGAAELLKISASTLNSKIRRLKIKKVYTDN